MIDLHCHILPAVDDGPRCIEESLRMARLAVADGINVMVAAVHAADPRGVRNSPEEVRAAAAEFEAALREEGIALRLFYAHEVMINERLPQQLRGGELLTIGDLGTHLLVELPSLMVPLCAEQVLFEVMTQGVTPILAHPEKSLPVQDDASLIRRLVERDYLIQLDADSLDGRAPRRVEGTALHLLREGLAHIIASDGHWAVQRPPLMSGARGRVARLMGQKAAEEVTRALPRKILRLAVNRASGP